ncbi:hypothetical protein T484DRAFT_3298201 [Baffinella frigidus]|nr:hypothetical protein T484DRAFT_3298201 [Cryptophyta sp. CCMP2293]
MCPGAYSVALGGTFPVTASGKLNRGALPMDGSVLCGADGARLGENAESGGELATGMERKVARAWSEVLGLPRQVLASDDHFFRCGGDSLAALTLTKRLMQWEQSGAPDEGGRCTPSLALLPSLARHASLALRRRRLRVPRALGDASCTNIGLFSC